MEPLLVICYYIEKKNKGEDYEKYENRFEKNNEHMES